MDYNPDCPYRKDDNSDWVGTDDEGVTFADIVRRHLGGMHQGGLEGVKAGTTGKTCNGKTKKTREETSDDREGVLTKKIFPRAILDFVGVSGKDKAKLGVKMSK